MSTNHTSTCRQFYPEDFCEYALAVPLSEEVAGDFKKEKKYFSYQFGSSHPTPGSIVLARFEAKGFMEEILMRWIQNTCRLQEALTLKLNNFSSIPPHTICIRVQDPAPLVQFSQKLRMLDAFMEASNCPPLQLEKRPSLALVSGLSIPVYEKAVPAYARRCYQQAFVADKLVLLKKRSWEEGWSLVNTFTFSHALS